VSLSDHPRRRPGCPVMLGNVRLLNGAGQPVDQILCGEPLTIEIELDPACETGEHHVGVGFDDNLGCRLFTIGTYLTDSLGGTARNPRRFRCELETLPLAPGRYGISINAGSRHFPWTDYIDQALWFEVSAADFYGNGRLPAPDCGRFLMRSNWVAE
jgi:hypothetical protein